jgi:hypothetical protein
MTANNKPYATTYPRSIPRTLRKQLAIGCDK